MINFDWAKMQWSYYLCTNTLVLTPKPRTLWTNKATRPPRTTSFWANWVKIRSPLSPSTTGLRRRPPSPAGLCLAPARLVTRSWTLTSWRRSRWWRQGRGRGRSRTCRHLDGLIGSLDLESIPMVRSLLRMRKMLTQLQDTFIHFWSIHLSLLTYVSPGRVRSWWYWYSTVIHLPVF